MYDTIIARMAYKKMLAGETAKQSLMKEGAPPPQPGQPPADPAQPPQPETPPVENAPAAEIPETDYIGENDTKELKEFKKDIIDSILLSDGGKLSSETGDLLKKVLVQTTGQDDDIRKFKDQICDKVLQYRNELEAVYTYLLNK